MSSKGDRRVGGLTRRLGAPCRDSFAGLGTVADQDAVRGFSLSSQWVATNGTAGQVCARYLQYSETISFSSLVREKRKSFFLNIPIEIDLSFLSRRLQRPVIVGESGGQGAVLFRPVQPVACPAGGVPTASGRDIATDWLSARPCEITRS